MDDGLYRLVEVTDHGAGDAATFAATPHVVSPWGPDLQHGGPVAGLLTRALERCAPRPGSRLSRISIDLLGAVPVADVRVSARVARPGRRVELLTAQMQARGGGDWRPVATASAWRLVTTGTGDVAHEPYPALPFDEAQILALPGFPLPPAWRGDGFVGAVTWRIVRIGRMPGEASLGWTSLDLPLVAGEPTSALQTAMTLADVANGLGARLDPSHFSFLNTDLTVHLHQPPDGRWLGFAAETAVGADGIATSRAALHSWHGPIGTLAQNVLVERRRD